VIVGFMIEKFGLVPDMLELVVDVILI